MIAVIGLLACLPSQATTPPAERLTRALFCETPHAFDEAACQWQVVKLPHRWAPSRPGYHWGLYRIETQAAHSGDLALMAERLSLQARVRVNGQAIATPWPINNADSALRVLRYWPQLFPILRDQPTPGLTIDIALQGHSDIKSGIGLLMIGPLSVLQDLHWKETLIEVQLPLALAAAIFMAGLLGLMAGGSSPMPARLLRWFSLIALLAATRTALNYVAEPPMPAAVWAILNHWLLLSISVMTCAGIAVYLTDESRRCLKAALLGIVGLAWLLVALPAGAPRYLGVEVVSLVLAALGLVLVVLLAQRVRQRREPIGMALLGGLCVLILFGVHDLWVHLSVDSQSDRYIQRWSTPALIIILILMLTRRVQAQRDLELRLAQETGHREALLRNLHDGIGSRLVALAFHARRQDPSGLLSEEIQNLMNELQMIQRAVRTEPTTLGQLLADQRHLYARVGGGRLPLHWDLEEGPGHLILQPDQVLATLRIVDEAIANAMKHAQPEHIRIRLLLGIGSNSAVLRIEDDGGGAFQIGRRGGLQNMRFRAQSAGLDLQFESSVGAKAVVLRYPSSTQGTGLAARFRKVRDPARTTTHRETP